jgi:precorrin-2 dehydrogenase / sirohydrochlorin ferrochelatase
MKHYPIFLDIACKQCVVVGGGEVAERKVERLLDCNAKVTVVSMKLTPGLAAWRDQGRLVHRRADYDTSDLRDAFLVIGATDIEAVNEAVSRDAQALGRLVNIVDDPANCNFILPSLFQQGDLTIAVSTGGKSPALSRKMREDFACLYGREYGTLVEILGRLRERILSRGRSADENKKIFDALVRSEILEYIRRGDAETVRQMILSLTGEDLPVSL